MKPNTWGENTRISHKSKLGIRCTQCLDWLDICLSDHAMSLSVAQQEYRPLLLHLHLSNLPPYLERPVPQLSAMAVLTRPKA
ncbi:hypothetical protein CDAR_321041 [Caerostris darwini]|uniref:Uncharacterized protein n=1 Tax=Caerostris darwini TaxID=1538125 RepID=A0AAV4WX58_9ARAC|nr:hypothetical protein CDAR_321041 [Caerostris darwini]